MGETGTVTSAGPEARSARGGKRDVVKVGGGYMINQTL